MSLKHLSLICLMQLVGSNALAANKSTEMTNSAIGRAPTDIRMLKGAAMLKGAMLKGPEGFIFNPSGTFTPPKT